MSAPAAAPDDDAACGLSARGTATSMPALSYFGAFMAAAADPFQPDAPSRGVINLCVAEDKLSADLVAAKLAATAVAASPPAEALGYTDMRGMGALRASLARYVTRSLAPGVPCDPAHLCLSAGCGAVFDMLAWTLAGAGDSFLIPAPLYAAFVNDLRVRGGVTAWAVAEPDGSLIPTVAALEAARLAAAAAGSPARALLLCNPGNPAGQVLPPSRVRELLAWALFAGLHVISDEVYAGSVFAPDAGPPFVSAARHAADGLPGVSADTLRDKLHIVFGFSKDFAMSGAFPMRSVRVPCMRVRWLDGTCLLVCTCRHARGCAVEHQRSAAPRAVQPGLLLRRVRADAALPGGAARRHSVA
jgi:aspartate/methionine/tyrosine aminotransferase